jgi:purine-binding chemotaxis protein CheW
MNENKAENRYMEFALGGQFFAIPIKSVKEVIQRPEFTAMPNMPAHFEGMINLRGKILGVFNIRKKLNVKKVVQQAEQIPDVVIVVEHDSITVGMLVDEVTRVIHVTEGMIKDAPLKDDDPSKKYILKIIQTKEALVLQVDVNELLEMEKYRKQLAA